MREETKSNIYLLSIIFIKYLFRIEKEKKVERISNNLGIINNSDSYSFLFFRLSHATDFIYHGNNETEQRVYHVYEYIYLRTQGDSESE